MTRGGSNTVQERHEESAVIGDPSVEVFLIAALSPTRTSKRRKTLKSLTSKHGRQRELLNQGDSATITISFKNLEAEDEQMAPITMTVQA